MLGVGWLTKFLLFTIFTFTPSNALLTRTNTSRYSVVSTSEGHALTGYVIHRQETYDFLSCAQLCLSHLMCASFNHENVQNGLCELNRAGLGAKETGINRKALSVKKGFTFGQLMNISVSFYSVWFHLYTGIYY